MCLILTISKTLFFICFNLLQHKISLETFIVSSLCTWFSTNKCLFEQVFLCWIIQWHLFWVRKISEMKYIWKHRCIYDLTVNTNSLPKVFCEKGVLRNFAKFTGNQPCQGLFFNKEILLKKILWHSCFPVNFAKFLRTPFFTEYLRWLFWVSFVGCICLIF